MLRLQVQLTGVMLDAAAITEAMTRLATTRPVFHSEADFQHALAWALHETCPQYRVRLETRPAKGVHLDLLVTELVAGRSTALELKYLTAAWHGTAGGESFALLSQGAQDIRAYDCIKDLGRVEAYVAHHPGSVGAVVILANDPNYWTPPSHGLVTNAQQFRVHEGVTITGTRSWGPHTGAGTLKNRESPIVLRGSYICRWRDYSSLPGAHGRFRYLLLPVGRDGIGLSSD